MAYIKIGTEGELDTHTVVLDTTTADINHRGAAPFIENEYTSVVFGARPEVWWHGKLSVSSAPNVFFSANGPKTLFSVRDAAGNILITAYVLRTGLNNRNLTIAGVNGDSTALSTIISFGKPSANIYKPIDLHVKLTGTTLILEVYIDNTIWATRTVVGVAPIWGQPTIGTYGHYGTGTVTTRWHEVGASISPTVGVTLSTLEASSAGFHNDGVGSYTNLSEPGVDLSTYVDLQNIGDKQSWIITPLVGRSFGTSAMRRIICSTLAVRAGGAVTGYRYFVRSGGIDYPTAGGIHTAGTELTNIIEEVTINSSTGNPFNGTELAAGVEIGIEAV